MYLSFREIKKKKFINVSIGYYIYIKNVHCHQNWPKAPNVENYMKSPVLQMGAIHYTHSQEKCKLQRTADYGLNVIIYYHEMLIPFPLIQMLREKMVMIKILFTNCFI